MGRTVNREEVGRKSGRLSDPRGPRPAGVGSGRPERAEARCRPPEPSIPGRVPRSVAGSLAVAGSVNVSCILPINLVTTGRGGMTCRKRQALHGAGPGLRSTIAAHPGRRRASSRGGGAAFTIRHRDGDPPLIGGTPMPLPAIGDLRQHRSRFETRVATFPARTHLLAPAASHHTGAETPMSPARPASGIASGDLPRPTLRTRTGRGAGRSTALKCPSG